MKYTKLVILFLTVIASLFVIYQIFYNPKVVKKQPTNQIAKTPYYLDNKKIQIGDIKIASANLKKVAVTYQSPRAIAAGFGFSGEPKSGFNEVSWENGSKKLTLNNASYSFTYQDATVGSRDFKTKSEIENYVVQVVKDLGIYRGKLDVKVYETTLMTATDLSSPTSDFGAAGGVVVQLQPTYDDVPVLLGNPGVARVYVYTDKKGTITKITGPYLLNLGQETAVTLKDSKRAIAEVKDKKGKVASIVVVDQIANRSIVDFDYTEMTVESGRLAYNLVDSILEPIYVFQAGAKNKAAVLLQLTIYLPASK